MSIAKVIAMMGAVQFAQFIGEHHYLVSGPTSVSFSGALAGDLAVLIVMYDSGVAPTGWTAAGASVAGVSSGVDQAYYKVLTAGDIATGSLSMTGRPNGAEIAILFYRGPTVATVVSSATGTGSSLAITGFTKDYRSQAAVSYATCGGHGPITIPSGMTERVASFDGPSGTISVADFLPAATYANGATVTWGGVLAAFPNGGQIIELT